jgi:hypothetical protein
VRRALLIGLVAVLIGAGSAGAAGFAPVNVTGNAAVARDLALAVTYWHKTPACGHVSVVLEQHLAPAEDGDGDEGSAQAETVPGECQIFIGRTVWGMLKRGSGAFDQELACVMIAHEYGHTLGLPDVPEGQAPAIMWTDVEPTLDPVCEHAYPEWRKGYG